MKILVIGSGGREHALAWKLAQSPRVDEVLVAPGNAGTAREPASAATSTSRPTDIDGLLALARARRRRADRGRPGRRRWSPAWSTASAPRACASSGRPPRAAQLEGSKAFAKDFLARHGIPTAHYAVHTDVDAALAYVRAKGAPIVIKADGLAAGKGVIVAMTLAEAEAGDARHARAATRSAPPARAW